MMIFGERLNAHRIASGLYGDRVAALRYCFIEI